MFSTACRRSFFTTSSARRIAGTMSVGASPPSRRSRRKPRRISQQRRGPQAGHRRHRHLRRVPVGIDLQRRALHRGPVAVVVDDGEHRQESVLCHHVARGRIREHVGAVAHGGDHGAIGIRLLDAERGGQSPAEAARHRVAEEGARLLEVVQRAVGPVFVHHDRVLRAHFLERGVEHRDVGTWCFHRIAKVLRARLAHRLAGSRPAWTCARPRPAPLRPSPARAGRNRWSR